MKLLLLLKSEHGLWSGMVRKPGKHQRSKQICQDLGWKVHDRAKSFVSRSYTKHGLRNQHVFIG